MSIMNIKIFKKNESFLTVSASDIATYNLIYEYFSFKPNGYQFSPAYKSLTWDGYIRLFDSYKNTLPIGLLDILLSFCKDKNINVDVDIEVYKALSNDNFNKDAVTQYFNDLIVSNGNERIFPRDYQLEPVILSTKNKKQTIKSPTGSGKSLIAYLIMRYQLDVENVNKILIIVPTVSLVNQLYSDFKEYSQLNDFDVEANIHRIYAGQDKNSKCKVIISTWQSIYKLNQSYFKQYDSLIIDECHSVDGKSLSGILNNTINAEWRIGLTATPKDGLANPLQLIGSIGPISEGVTTHKLIENNILSDISIQPIHIKYSKEFRDSIPNTDYNSIKTVLRNYEPRNKLILGLCESQHNSSVRNTLIITETIEQSKYIEELLINNLTENRNVYRINGSMPANDRERIRKKIESENGSIIIATLGIFKLGINIKNLHTLILAHSFKNIVSVKQVIGRILRKSTDGESSKVYDLIDYSFSVFKDHGETRKKIYNREKFKVYKPIEIMI